MSAAGRPEHGRGGLGRSRLEGGAEGRGQADIQVASHLRIPPLCASGLQGLAEKGCVTCTANLKCEAVYLAGTVSAKATPRGGSLFVLQRDPLDNPLGGLPLEKQLFPHPRPRKCFCRTGVRCEVSGLGV